MKFTCTRDAILREITIAQEIISSRNSLSILSNVLLSAEEGSLVIKATDLKVSFETRIPVEIKEEGNATVFCDKLLGILRSLPEGEIEFEVLADDRFIIRPRFKKIDFRLKSISADKFPEIENAKEDSYFNIAQADLNAMITQTVFAVSDDETRYFMNGVFFEKNDLKLVMVATDGRRLSYVAKDVGSDVPSFSGVIIPPKILNMVKKLSSGQGQMRLAINEKQVFFEFDNLRLSSALIEGQFPNYNRVIPESQRYSVIVKRDELNEALKRVSLLVEKSRRVYMSLEADSLTLTSEESEIGVAKEEIPCQYEGPESKIALNFQYLSDPLKCIEGEEVSIRYTETVKAISIYSVPERDYFHIVMPMQLD